MTLNPTFLAERSECCWEDIGVVGDRGARPISNSWEDWEFHEATMAIVLYAYRFSFNGITEVCDEFGEVAHMLLDVL